MKINTAITAAVLCFAAMQAAAQITAPTATPTPMTNVYGRNPQLLNGKWAAIIDPYDQGVPKEIYLDRTPQNDTEFFEYAFDGGMRLEVPSDWNSQMPELKYYEGTIWYARHLLVGEKASPREGQCATTVEMPREDERLFLCFGAVNYRCNVYLNGSRICSHEGGFTPFEVEIGDKLREGDNFLAVEVDNRRRTDAIPAMAFDWWNYGGITRDVMIVRTPKVYVRDYFLRLGKDGGNKILFSVDLSEAASREVTLEIGELGISKTLKTDGRGHGEAVFETKKLKLWAPEAPYLYDVRLTCDGATIEDRIGFRRVAVDGTKILVNGREVFLRSISFHEEIPQRMGRACTQADARMLLSEAKELGANTIRLAHYPQNEYTVRMAEEMGFILWEEIPIWQGIDFTDTATSDKAHGMLREMITRDRNRCAICLWGIANETRPSQARNAFLKSLLDEGKSIDTSRLFVAAFDNAYFIRENDRFEMDDDFARNLDVVAVNKYMGWYAAWPKDPATIRWEICTDKPLMISEFGGEALYGQHGNAHRASSWSEEYQAQLYADNLAMFANIPNLAGISPWILFDFRSPYRFHPTNQEGWNRKGLLSDRGQKKKAWYIIRDFYRTKRNEQSKK
ncbi:MAG: glycoside hydrolase family 2 [Alistipes sp.]|nr:glycoside hydrolase family 2 [Alistipes sp.]